MDTRTVYFICDNGAVYTSDKRDLAHTTPFNSVQFQNDIMNAYSYENVPWIMVSEISGVNPTSSTVKSYNGLIYNAKTASVKMTLTFPTMRQAHVVISNLSGHLVFLGIAVDESKKHIFTKRAMISSAEKVDGIYENGVQYDLNIAVDGFWTGSAYYDHTSGSGVNIPKNYFPQNPSSLSKWSGDGVISSQAYPNVKGFKMSCPHGDFSITVDGTRVDFTTANYPVGSSADWFVASNGIAYRQDREDLLGIDQYLKRIKYNFTPAISDIVGNAGSIVLGGLNLGAFVKNKTSSDFAYSQLLNNLKAIGTRSVNISVSGAEIHGVAGLEYKPFI